MITHFLLDTKNKDYVVGIILIKFQNIFNNYKRSFI